MSSNYRILKLRSGEDIIAKIVGQDQKVFILERPFMFRTMPIMDPLGRTREITTLRNWVKHTTQLRIKIPKDHIAMFMDPDPDAEHLYEMEMEREDTDSGPKKIGPLESLFEQMTGTDDPDTSPTLEDMINKVANTPAQMDIDEKIKDMLDTMQDHIDDIEDENDDAMQEKDYVMMNMAFPASFLDDLLKRGVLNPQDLLNMKKAIDEENEIDDDDIMVKALPMNTLLKAMVLLGLIGVGIHLTILRNQMKIILKALMKILMMKSNNYYFLSSS